MSQVLEDRFKQKLIALIADNGYNLGTTFDWNTVADLKGRKIAGAGLNLKWLEFAGITACNRRCPMPIPRCRPAYITAGSCSRRVG